MKQDASEESGLRILIAVPAQDQVTGNWITARRFQQGLESLGHNIHLIDTPLEPAPLEQAVIAETPDLVLLLHAFRTGRPWLALAENRRIPFLVLLTGTDINHGIGDPQQGPIIREVLGKAAGVLTQNPLTEKTFRREHGDLASRLHYLPPGIHLGEAPFALRRKYSIPTEAPLFLCPAGLRPVKGVLELLHLCDPLFAAFAHLRVAFCGPPLDPEYSRRFFAALRERPQAIYLGLVPPEAMAAAMREADVIVNNSASEGLPNALLEASALGKPILARDIPGNAAVVKDGANGLLFRDPAGFAAAAARLLEEPGLRQDLSLPGFYSLEREARILDAICRRVASPGGQRPGALKNKGRCARPQ